MAADRGIWQGPDLRDRVAVVTGASRGAGKGIAAVLGECGATVYVTGRSMRGGATTDGLPGTIEDAAELVTSRGGVGIAVRCDHTNEEDVAALFDRVRGEQGRLDFLVNNAWGGYQEREGGWERFPVALWEQDLTHWDGMFTAGVRASFLSSHYAIPLMLPQRSGLIVNTTYWDRDRFLYNAFYDVAKAAINRMAFHLAAELRAFDIAALALSPGFMRTEGVLRAYASEQGLEVLEQRYGSREIEAVTESTEYTGRAVATLAANPDIMGKSGGTYVVGDLAREYGFTDIDGRQPVFQAET
jgi:NAD(P)-dependent dehydrogenase (short-subunit alcohol dehydrogenase family)